MPSCKPNTKQLLWSITIFYTFMRMVVKIKMHFLLGSCSTTNPSPNVLLKMLTWLTWVPTNYNFYNPFLFNDQDSILMMNRVGGGIFRNGKVDLILIF